MPLKDKEKQKGYLKTYYQHNKDKFREIQFKRLYGISLEEYDTLFSDQRGKCAICDTHQLELDNALHVDHCHTTGKVRGLLCRKCNLILGHSRDDSKLLKLASEYLDNYDR